MPIVSKTIDERNGNRQVTPHRIRLTTSSSRSGLWPSPVLATASPPMMKPALSAPQSRPQACTDISDRP